MLIFLLIFILRLFELNANDILKHIKVTLFLNLMKSIFVALKNTIRRVYAYIAKRETSTRERVVLLIMLVSRQKVYLIVIEESLCKRRLQ